MKKDSTGKSLVFKFIENISVKGIGFVISILLARILEPKVFGLIAIINAINAIAQTFVESGLGTALIQNKSADDRDYSTVFYLSLIIATIVYIVLFLSAPYISLYYELEELTLPLRVLSFSLIIYSFNSVQSAKLTREMQFGKMLISNIVVTIITGLIGVTMALYGFEVWALVFYYLLHSIFISIAYVFVLKWFPKWVFSIKRAKELFDYGYKMLLSGLLTAFFNNLRTLIIGKLYSPADLGYYNRGEQVPSVIASTIEGVFRSVMLPTFSRSQGEKDRLKSLLRRTVVLNSFINFPAMVGLAVVASPLVKLLFTEKWLFSVPYLQVLAFAQITVSIKTPCLVLIQAMGRSDIYLKLELFRRIIMLGILFLSLCFHSLLAIAIGWLISNIIDLIIVLIPIKRLIGYSWSNQFCDVLPYLLISFFMAGVIYCIGLLGYSVGLTLLLQISVGMAVYFLTAWIFKTEGLVYLLDRMNAFIKNSSSF